MDNYEHRLAQIKAKHDQEWQAYIERRGRAFLASIQGDQARRTLDEWAAAFWEWMEEGDNALDAVHGDV